MRQVFESGLEIDVGWLSLFDQQVMRQGEPFFREPFLGCFVEGFLEIALESGQTSPCQVPELFHRHVEDEILFHEGCEVDFSGFVEIREEAIDGRIDRAQDTDGFDDFQFGQMLWKIALKIEIRN